MPARPFTDTLISLRYGELHDELTTKLNALVGACVSTGGEGTLTLTLRLKPSKGHAMEIVDDVKIKTPELARGATLMFPTPENNLTREDPRQLKLEGIRSVDRETGEIRDVANR